eukprot:SAG25_NODE_5366_length_667_cov_0.589789_1_plen_45_part_10
MPEPNGSTRELVVLHHFLKATIQKKIHVAIVSCIDAYNLPVFFID